MKKLEITFSRNLPKDITIDENPPLGLEAFLLITHRQGADEGHFLAFGGSDRIGKMLYNFYLQCLHRDENDMGHVLELVAQDILAAAKAARGRKWVQPMVLPETVN